MRFAFVTATPQSVEGGSGTYLASEQLSSGLRSLGHDVRVVAPRPGNGAGPFTLRRFAFNRRLRPGDFADADVVVGWDMDGYRLAGRLPCPFVAYVHGTIADEARFERGAVRASMQLQALAERRSVSRSTRAFTVSAFARDRLVRLYQVAPDHVGIVPPALDVGRWRMVLERARTCARPTRPVVLSVARLYARKDLKTLLRAAHILRREVPHLLVRIVGDGPERHALANEARRLDLRGTVEWHGQIPFAALASAYVGCDVFCLPSLQEGFGIVFLEAMMAGRPIVACRGTAAEELIGDGRHGLLVPAGNADALARVLRHLLADDALRHRIGARGPERAAQFAAPRIAERFLAELPLCASAPVEVA